MIQEFFSTFVAMLNEMSPYLLLGFFIAGVLHAFVPSRVYSRHLSAPTLGSVFKAAAFGVPLPLCSCGVIPTAMSLRNEGASEGSTVAFLIATPQTGVDSIAATYSLLGLPFAILRPVAALVTSVFGGMITNKFGVEKVGATADVENCNGECAAKRELPKGFFQKMKETVRYGFFTMMQDIGKWLVIGLLLAAAITMFIPDDFFTSYVSNPFLEMLIMLAIAVPMYTCATGSIPVAVALMMKGLSPGAALVLLMAGPATNIASIFVVYKVLGFRTTATYIASIVMGAMVFGLIIDYVLPSEWFDVTSVGKICCNHTMSTGLSIASVALSAMLLFALYKRYFHKQINKNGNMKLFKVTGMACNHCRNNVINNISTLDGVESVDVDLEKGVAAVKGNVPDDVVIKKVESLGYGCTKIS